MRSALSLSVALLAGGMALTGSVEAVDVHVGIDIGIPAPPSIVIAAPPRLLVVPGVPVVRYGPDIDVNFFSYGGQYYTCHDDAWFVARSHNGPWVYLPPARVPRVFYSVPVRYYKIPPGQLKKMYGHPGKHHGHGGWDDGDEHHGHGHGHGHGHDD